MNKDVFLYGTLRYVPLLETVLGRSDFETMPASLADHAAMTVSGETYPGLRAQKGGKADGVLLISPTEADLERLDFYEGDYHYALGPVTVETATGARSARAYLPTDGQPPGNGAWDFDAWREAYGEATALAAAEVMALKGEMTPAEVRAIYPTILIRAWSALRARTGVAPADLRRSHGASEVEIRARRKPYTDYFGVSEMHLRHPVVDGGTGPEIRRAAFLMGDAVTVLPYDPVRDRVLVIGQFRYGPFMRRDPRPWCLEPIAGRVDPGEVPEKTARRETREEAGLDVGALHLIGRYYPSPAAVTEWLVSYVALADLPDSVAGRGGLDSEAEDIVSHVISYDRLMELVASGEVATGPLLLSAYWLSAHRDRLRALA